MAAASLSGSAAVLKTLYPGGELPKALQKNFALYNKIKKVTTFEGENEIVALQNANPQGSSAVLSTAITNVVQGSYKKFTLTRKSHYGVVEISGEALKAATKRGGGALVDLWENETRGAAMTEMSVLETYLFGTGDGVLGGTLYSLSGQVATIGTAAAPGNMNHFELGMTCKSVSAVGTSPTVRDGEGVITSIDRRARTVTFTGTLTGFTSNDFLVRSGDQAGSAVVNIVGLGAYVEGGTSPSALNGLTRTTDPVRLAGQSISYSGWDMADAVVDASAQSTFQGATSAKTLVCNPIDLANMKKSSLSPKIVYQGGGGTATAGFGKVVIEGESGAIEVMADPFCPRNKAFLIDVGVFELHSLGKAPQLQDWDSLEMLRGTTTDTFQTRFVSYAELACRNPMPNVQLTSWGL